MLLELPGGFLESLVEGGHVRGEYTKDGWGKLGSWPISKWGQYIMVMKKITFNADPDLLDRADCAQALRSADGSNGLMALLKPRPS